MTVLQEIALRQSLTYGGFAVAALLALLYAILLSHRPASVLKSAAATLPIVALLVAAVASFAAPLIITALCVALITEIALSRGTNPAWWGGSIGIFALQTLFTLHFLRISNVADFLILPAILAIVVALYTEFKLRKHRSPVPLLLRIHLVFATVMMLAALCLRDNLMAQVGGVALFLSVLLFIAMQLSIFKSPQAGKFAATARWFLAFFAQAAILAGAGFAQPLFSI
ncbi:MAG: hypothetical protein ACRBBQ_13245 [Cognatishimia sp.]